MKIIPKICPRCKAPLDLKLDHNNIDTCEYCDTKLYFSGGEIISDLDLTANHQNKQYNVKACANSQMRSVCPAEEKARQEKLREKDCPQKAEIERAEMRRRLNEARMAAPPEISVDDLFKDPEPRSFTDLVMESLWETMTFPFRAVRWLSEHERDDRGGGHYGLRGSRRRSNRFW